MLSFCFTYKFAFNVVIMTFAENGKACVSLAMEPEGFDNLMKTWEMFRPTITEVRRMIADGATPQSIQMFIDEGGAMVKVPGGGHD